MSYLTIKTRSNADVETDEAIYGLSYEFEEHPIVLWAVFSGYHRNSHTAIERQFNDL
jgi:hypothetical protein